MQHWNQHFNNRYNHDRIHGNDRVTNNQLDYTDNRDFNMPYGNEGYGNPYHQSHMQHWQNNNQYNQAPNENYFDQQMMKHEQNLRLHTGRHTENDWNKLVNWADNVTDPHQRLHHNHRQDDFMMNNNGHREAYNPQNRNYNPIFADDESGFSGGYRSANPDNNFDRDFGFDNNQSFHNRHRTSWPQNGNFNNNEHEGMNRWKNNSQNHGGFFGH